MAGLLLPQHIGSHSLEGEAAAAAAAGEAPGTGTAAVECLHSCLPPLDPEVAAVRIH